MIRIKSRHTDVVIPDQKLRASTTGEGLYVSVALADPDIPFKILGQTPYGGALEISYEEAAQ